MPVPLPNLSSSVTKTDLYTDKKKTKIFLIYKEIQSGAVAKSLGRAS